MERTYCGPPPLPVDIWTSWNTDPFMLAALVVLAVLLRHDAAGRWAVAVLVLAFVSPLCALSSALFSARVVHHLLLIAVAAPLLAWARPANSSAGLGASFAVATIVLWLWHYPGAYDLALSHVGWYWLSQVTLLGSAVWFWRNLFAGREATVTQFVFVIASFAQMGMLGAIVTFAGSGLYVAHAIAPLAWGMTPLQDQQLGGLIMWVPAGIPYAIAAVLLARQSWARLRECQP